MYIFDDFFWSLLEVAILMAIAMKIISRSTMDWCKSNACLIGRTVIITGGNSGLGYQTALALAGRGGKIIIADVKDTTESVRQIKEYTHNENVVGKYLDLASLDSVRAFAKEIHEEEDRLDILVNNAGILGLPYTYTKDGLQIHMQVNYFGHFLLTHLLTDLLKKAAPSRIVFVSSIAAFTHNLTTLERVNNPVQYGNALTHAAIYSNSKLCTLIASNLFAEKLSGFGVTSNALHPGCVRTSIMSNSFDGDYKIFRKLFMSTILLIVGKTPYEGAQTQINCALSNSLIFTTGKYFVACKPFRQPSKTGDKEFCERLWELSETLVKLTPEDKLIY